MDQETKKVQTARNAATTRQAILEAGRRQFARDSYENVGVRDIAGDAGVDPALIVRYFGGKEELFREVMEQGRDDTFWDGVTAPELPERLVSLIMEKSSDSDEAAAKTEMLMIILRSASSPKASAIVVEAMDNFMLEPIASMLPGREGQLRACMAMTVLMGSGIVRQVMSVKPICEVRDDLLRAQLISLFKAALAEPARQACR